jgi:DNA-binding transcriptional LysR family regulator
LSELAAALPGLELKFSRGDAARLMQLMKSGDCELALAGAIDGDWERLDSWLLFEEGFRLIAPRGHRLVGRNRLSVADLADERVFARPHCENANDWTAILGAAGIGAGTADDVGSDQDLLKLVAAGVGIAFIPNSTSIAGDLAPMRLDGLDLRREVRLSAVAGRPRSAAAGVLITLLRAADWSRLESAPLHRPA